MERPDLATMKKQTFASVWDALEETPRAPPICVSAPTPWSLSSGMSPPAGLPSLKRPRSSASPSRGSTICCVAESASSVWMRWSICYRGRENRWEWRCVRRR